MKYFTKKNLFILIIIQNIFFSFSVYNNYKLSEHLELSIPYEEISNLNSDSVQLLYHCYTPENVTVNYPDGDKYLVPKGTQIPFILPVIEIFNHDCNTAMEELIPDRTLLKALLE